MKTHVKQYVKRSHALTIRGYFTRIFFKWPKNKVTKIRQRLTSIHNGQNDKGEAKEYQRNEEKEVFVFLQLINQYPDGIGYWIRPPPPAAIYLRNISE